MYTKKNSSKPVTLVISLDDKYERAVMTLLINNPLSLTSREISRRLDIPLPVAQSALNKLFQRGYIARERVTRRGNKSDSHVRDTTEMYVTVAYRRK